jgi:Tol biopolymer transport system component
VVVVPTGAVDTPPEALPPYGPDQHFEPWSWSPDGKTLAGSIDGVGVILYSIPERTYRRITDFGGHPVWFGDERRLLFVSNRKIYMVGSDGGGLREIYAAAPAVLRPFLSVSGDGQTIFTSLSATDDSIWIANLE